jgi:hypothetical protein
MEYATVADLEAYLGTVDPDRATVAIQAASDYIDGRTGGGFTDPPPAGVHWAAVIVGCRFYRDPEQPWGTFAGIGEVPVYMKYSPTDIDLLLLGHRTSFGIA